MSTPVNLPRVDTRFVNERGRLTEYGRQLLNGLLTRTGGADGIDIKDLEVYINLQLQDDREAPVPSLLQPPAPPDDAPVELYPMENRDDNVSIGFLMAYVRKLESRISELEEAPQWQRNPSL